MFKNKYDTPITNLQVVPAQEALAGTIDAAAGSINVTGIGTDFNGDVAPGDFIWANNEIRRVETVSYSSQLLTVNEPFTAPVVTAPLEVVRKAQLKSLSLLNDGPGAVTVDGNTLALGGIATFNRDSSNLVGDEYIDPVVVDASGGNSVSVLKIK